ncbi:MAG TPA: D-amino-acid transaminase [Caulobacteraceae bacterium]|nr:D-amino-acid transaminase [Caulobacteraceae bacterium]
MSRIAYVNGRFVRYAEAGVSIEDRGFQFADGVYEVWGVLGGRLTDWDGHAERLERSLSELKMAMPMSQAALLTVLRETVRRNRVVDGIVYLQVTRGVARRDHAFPRPGTPLTVVVTAKSVDLAAEEAKAARGVAVVTQPDIRWGRCDIKTVGLLPNALAKQAAREAGAYEAWLVDRDGYVTEGSSTNAWIVDGEGRLRTRDTGANILRGVTRKTLVTLAAELQLPVLERPFTVAEALGASEAFLTAATAFVTPVVTIDGKPVGSGRPGPVAGRLRSLYLQQARNRSR